MEHFIQDLASTYWWIILLVGLAVGVLGTFMADGIKKLWGLVSSRQRERNARIKERNLELVEHLVKFPGEVVDYQFRASQFSQAATRAIIIAFALLIISKPGETTQSYILIVVGVFALLPMYRFTRNMVDSRRCMDIVQMARKRLRDNSEVETTESNQDG